MVSMALTNQRRSSQGRKTSYGNERAVDLSTARLPYCYYYLRVLYFANFCDLEKFAKLSTRKNFYQP